MNILVIGSGGREHALVYALFRSKSASKIYAAPGNPGIFGMAHPSEINISKHSEVVDFCKNNKIDLVVVGPEQPLAEGLSDSLRTAGINVFGPSKSAAQLETSKGFAKAFMQHHGIPTASYREFGKENPQEAHDFIDSLFAPIVLKADGLAAGKGVIIAESREEAHKSIDEMFGGMFASAGDKVIIEEFLTGYEASVFVVCDGKDYFILPAAQDHKRALDGDEGLNTGGMGAYSPTPLVTKEVMSRIEKKIIIPTLKGMNAENNPFIGCLFLGLMIKDGEPKVIEYNVRFGDPETEAVMTLVEGDFARLLYTAATGKINTGCVTVKENTTACCVILASEGYPSHYEKGFEINGMQKAVDAGGIVFQSGTKADGDKILTSGGRVLAVTGLGNSLPEAIEKSYKYVDLINFKNKYFRKDIGRKGLIFLKGND